jgi:long-chain acyl-CoA synthetase
VPDASPARSPHPWEAIYPPGVDWAAPIAINTLPALLDRSAEQFGDLPALRFRSTTLSYGELRRRADRLAAGLIAEGLRPGQAVGLLLSNTAYHPIAFFAVLRAGGRLVHLTPLDPLRAITRKLADSGADWLITTDLPTMLATAMRLHEEGHCARLFVAADPVWDDPGAATGLPGAEPPPHWPVVTPDDVALLQYTGGTTGLRT